MSLLFVLLQKKLTSGGKQIAKFSKYAVSLMIDSPELVAT